MVNAELLRPITALRSSRHVCSRGERPVFTYDVSVRRLTPSDYRRMPWRNGGGTTTEIAIAPEGASVSGERFLHRVSIADVASDGPFSQFPGYDRHIMLLAGAGMTLDCGAHGRIELRRFEPQRFSGDWAVHGMLVGGPVRDFNLMVDRARATSSLVVESIAGGQEAAKHGSWRSARLVLIHARRWWVRRSR